MHKAIGTDSFEQRKFEQRKFRGKSNKLTNNTQTHLTKKNTLLLSELSYKDN